MARILPALIEIRALTDAPISIDTTKSAVARAAIEGGATIVNDVSGLRDPEMAATAAEANAWLVLVHNTAIRPGSDVVAAVRGSLSRLVDKALAAGVSADRLLIDPGLGFHKDWRRNFDILRRLQELRTIGLPILVGASRKGMVARVLGDAAQHGVEGTAALCAIAIANGADVIRVHDVREMGRVARMMDALVRL
jgi:dihydropteroate synthase